MTDIKTKRSKTRGDLMYLNDSVEKLSLIFFFVFLAVMNLAKRDRELSKGNFLLSPIFLSLMGDSYDLPQKTGIFP